MNKHKGKVSAMWVGLAPESPWAISGVVQVVSNMALLLSSTSMSSNTSFNVSFLKSARFSIPSLLMLLQHLLRLPSLVNHIPNNPTQYLHSCTGDRKVPGTFL